VIATALVLIPLLIYVTPLIVATIRAANNPSDPYGM
jgi:hypothetical protein